MAICLPPRTLGNDDEVDADEQQEDDHTNGVVAANDKLTERLNHFPGLSLREDESGAGDVEADAEEREQQQQRGEAAEIQGVRGVQRHEKHHQRDPDAGRQTEVQQHRRQRDHNECKDEHHHQRHRELRDAVGFHGVGHGERGTGHAAAVPRHEAP